MNISFSKLGKHGRLGNQLFQIASTMGIAEKNGCTAAFPPWEYGQYFEDFSQCISLAAQSDLKEERFEHYDISQTNCDLVGYFQSEKYFDNIDLPFKFKADFKHAVRNKMPDLPVAVNILIHIRRGDYVGNENYYQLPITYYILALLKIPEWRECNVIFISDDLDYCKVHFGCLPNAYFADGLNDIESMCMASMCNHFILSNSTFSWWCARIGESSKSIVIHPGHLFAGQLALKNNTKDFWSERWTRFQLDSYVIPLKEMTFTIPVFLDHKDRKQNLDLSVCMLQTAFDTNIIIGEQGGDKLEYMSQWSTYMRFQYAHFHRTKMLNEMAKAADSEYIANWDCDIIIAPMQIYMAVQYLKDGADMVFPYDGRFARLPRKPWFENIQRSLDIGIVNDEHIRGRRGKAVPENSVGGAVFFNKRSFIAGGMENEHMISFGPEDCERNDRFTALGHDIRRTGGPLFHIDHWCGPNSSRHNPYFRANHKELDKIRLLDKEALTLYINTWSWRLPDITEDKIADILKRYCEWAGSITGKQYRVISGQEVLQTFY